MIDLDEEAIELSMFRGNEAACGLPSYPSRPNGPLSQDASGASMRAQHRTEGVSESWVDKSRVIARMIAILP